MRGQCVVVSTQVQMTMPSRNTPCHLGILAVLMRVHE